MTTSRVSVRRERVGAWPIFRQLALPNDMAAISVEIARSPDQAIGHAVGDVSALLGSSLAALKTTGEHKFWLVVAGAPIKRTDKLAAYRASREKAWGVLERQGVSIPIGTRSDLEIPLSGDSFTLLGGIDLELGALPSALSVTRLVDAVLIATHSLADPLPSLVPGLARRGGADGSRLLTASAQLHADWTFIARAYGDFDDRPAGVDVFASDSYLDVLEPVLAAEAGIDFYHDV